MKPEEIMDRCESKSFWEGHKMGMEKGWDLGYEACIDVYQLLREHTVSTNQISGELLFQLKSKLIKNQEEKK